MSKYITWLHLSDLHHCQPRTGWDSMRVLRTLCDDIARMKQEYGLCPDLLFFTGDAAYGNIGPESGLFIKDQFEGAYGVLEGIRTATAPEIASSNVFLVPGNHDVNRSWISPEQTAWLDGIKDLSNVHSMMQGNGIQWRRYLERLSDYRDFLKQHNYVHLDPDNEQLIYAAIRQINGVSVAIAGLNTAWSCVHDKEKGRLWMGGRWQIEQLSPDIRTAEIKIALMHHPTNWLVEFEDPEMQRLIEHDFDFCLHGHEHQHWVQSTSKHTRIAAGACYDSSDNENGYNFVRLDLTTGKGEVWLRRYDSRGGGWVPEVVHGKTSNDGVWPFTGPAPAARLMSGIHDVTADRQVISAVTGVGVSIVLGDGLGKRSPLHYASDLPPVIDAWVGRDNELAQLAGIHSGVVAITGIGGQGKSTLVAKYLDVWKSSNEGRFWDWRDCREEGERFHTQLVEIIERLTRGEISGTSIADADTRELVQFLFQMAADSKCLIVLDNVDHYVDTASSEFNLGVGLLVQEAFRVPHNILFVLTCRPQVSYAKSHFHEIRLPGLSQSEALELFKFRGIAVDDSTSPLIHEVHRLTEGHAFWLDLIAVQVARNPSTSQTILHDLRQAHIDDKSRALFKTLWSGLLDKQQLVLRSMAEVPYPETFENLEQFARPLLGNYSQFNKAFRSLRTMNLIVERGANAQGKKYDLHPLVRSYIRTEYSSHYERQRFITPILSFLERLFMGATGPAEDASLEAIERWMAKAELELASQHSLGALKSLGSAADHLIARGRYEEFLRVAKLILEDADWSNIEFQDLDAFHHVVSTLVITLVDHKREADARGYASRYGQSAGAGTVNYLRLCKMYCYFEWLLGNYNEAIMWGEAGNSFKLNSLIDTQVDITYDLALALRDSGRTEEALSLFTHGQTIEEFLNENAVKSGKSAADYGNVGRCLQFKGLFSKALQCYVKAAKLLDGKLDSTSVDNQGYASLWIGEVLVQMSQFDTAYIFFRRAASIWSIRAPLRVAEPMRRLHELYGRVSPSIWSLLEGENDVRCMSWIRQQ